VKTHFRTRAFLLCFLPFGILLTTGFWTVQRFVQMTVRDGLHSSLRESQIAIANIHAKGDLQNSRFLKVAGENSALKAGIQILHANPESADARRTVEDQLRELGEHMGFDFMLVSAPNGSPLAGVSRYSPSKHQHGQLVPLGISHFSVEKTGFLMLDGRTFQVASVPVDLDGENIGLLSVGEFFDFDDLTTLVALVHNGKVVDSNLPGIPESQLERAISVCPEASGCDLRLGGSNWISMPMQTYSDGYVLLSFQNVDEANAPIQARLHKLFLTLAIFSVLFALASSLGSSNSIVKPIAVVVDHLRHAVRTGKLSELEPQSSAILEVQELAEIYNKAAASVRVSGENLQAAYLQFVGSLASALDARDPYTAGHSHRVSQLSCAIATALALSPLDIERIRIGAFLHDIGKIGIADGVLQKPGRLTDEEFNLVRQHPVIGRRILEGVEGFAPYLGAVELHHENWNGTGYPHGQKAEETPIDARIIHVADAYDAMTTDRSYRRGMTHEKAISILVENAGVEFDPSIVPIFIALLQEILSPKSAHSLAATEEVLA
jgi:HD-GYP domain-containing protein (c-di-GMP phosphodiesterase class II)